MKSYEFEITIVGGGCFGASILFELTRRGFSNICLVDFGRNSMSATAHSGGMLRVFHENSIHVDLALANHAKLNRIKQAGVLTDLPKPNGSLYFFNKRRYQDYQSNLDEMNQSHYPFEVLTPETGRKNFPQFRWSDDEWAVYEPLGSQISTKIFVENLIASSQHAGATVLDGFEVQRLCRYSDQYRVSGQNATVTTKTLILAGGARLLPRFSDLGLRFPLTTKMLTTFVAERNPIAPPNTLSVPNYFDREDLSYGGFGSENHVTLSHLDDRRIAQPFWSSSFERKAAEDCYAPNRIGFTGQVAGFPRLNLATGWGGTGFKFALEIGHRIATAVEQTAPDRRNAYASF
jgi:glycine/D-amino acid oxidase-like deaminating enzyme